MLSFVVRLVPLVVAALAPLAAEASSPGETRTILVYGDSITWGWVPTAPITPTVRHAEEDRWPTIVGTTLGAGYNVITEGLSGRTTNVEDPTAPGLMNGADYFDSALMSHEPIDLVVIMLGTNDTKTYLDRSPLEIGLGMGELIDMAQRGSGLGWYAYGRPQILVISPPPLGDEVDPAAAEDFRGSNEKIAALPDIYARIAEAAGAHFFDAASVVEKGEVGTDGIHLLVQGNRDLGEAVAAEIREILE